MNFDLERMLESKRAFRRKLAAKPVAEKMRLLDELRARALALRRTRVIPTPGSTEVRAASVGSGAK